MKRTEGAQKGTFIGALASGSPGRRGYLLVDSRLIGAGPGSRPTPGIGIFSDYLVRRRQLQGSDGFCLYEESHGPFWALSPGLRKYQFITQF